MSEELKIYERTLQRQEAMVEKLMENAFNADERLARANEIVLKCADENHRLVTLVDKIANIYAQNIEFMQKERLELHSERKRLFDYILSHATQIELNNNNSI